MVKTYQIRKLTSYQKQNYFGITIPAEIANNFSGTSFSIEERNNCIILQSGCNNKQKSFEVI